MSAQCHLTSTLEVQCQERVRGNRALFDLGACDTMATIMPSYSLQYNPDYAVI